MQVSSVGLKPLGITAGDGERNLAQSSTKQSAPAKPLTAELNRPLKQQLNTQEKIKLAEANPRASDLKQTSLNEPKEKDPAQKNSTQEEEDSALKQVNDAFAKKSGNLVATIEKDKDTGINVLKITDKETKEVVRQFPSKAVIAMAQAIGESLDTKGQLISEKA